MVSYDKMGSPPAFDSGYYLHSNCDYLYTWGAVSLEQKLFYTQKKFLQASTMNVLRGPPIIISEEPKFETFVPHI